MRDSGAFDDLSNADLVGVIEASYDTASTDEAWLRSLAESARVALGGRFGVYAGLYDASDTANIHTQQVVQSHDLDAIDMTAVERMHAQLPRDSIASAYRSPNYVKTSSMQYGQGLKDYLGWSSTPGHGLDYLGLLGCDLTGIGVYLTVPLPSVMTLSPRQLTRWQRVVTHMVAGLRLRRHAVAPDEAVLRPDGKVEHAEGVAKDPSSLASLRETARAVDRARASMRRDDPDEAVATWRGLCAGRWSLVDRFERDGRRYLVARRNDPAVPVSAPLTLREQQVVAYAARGQPNKLIAYALGLSTPTVAGHLAHAAQKLGVRSRAELIRVAQAIGGAARDSSEA